MAAITSSELWGGGAVVIGKGYMWGDRCPLRLEELGMGAIVIVIG